MQPPYGGAAVAFGDITTSPTNMGASRLTVYNNYAGENSFSIQSALESTTGFTSPTTADVVLYGLFSPGFITSDAQLPISAYSTANFNDLTLSVQFYDQQGPQGYVGGDVTSLSVELVTPAAVPELSTTVSLGVLLRWVCCWD